ncbi:MAG: NAD(P)/FAD-dependent oxidoreductase [Halobacteriales archaeon]|nr:NAD(P)/FAD-dependent oxidoreductase [Halobacteriales archaeon]
MSAGTVVIAGAGLAGLVAARRLAKAGLDVEVYDRADRVGGRVRTDHVDGFTLDRGFQVLFTAYPAAKRELDYDALDLRRFSPGAVIARPGKRSVLSDPLREPLSAVESLFNDELTLGDKLRTLRLRRRLRGRDPAELLASADSDDDTTISRWLRQQGFSSQYIANFVAPFYGGITLDRSLNTSRAIFEYTFAMLASGATVVPADGMEAIPRYLANQARAAGATITTDTMVEAIDTNTNGVMVTLDARAIEADAAIVATGPRAARDLTDVAAIPTDTVACVTQYYALPAGKSLGVGRRIVLNAADAAPNQVVPHSAVAPEYAPERRRLVSATYLGERSETDDELATKTRSALSSWFPEQRFDTENIEVLETYRIDHAQFAQPPGFRRDLPGVETPPGRCYLAGDFTEWSSIQGALASGQNAARAVYRDLQ